MKKEFNPNSAGLVNNGIFGLPKIKNPQIVGIPIQWGVTTSSGGGTEFGPAAVLEATYMVDLYKEGYYDGDPWKVGYALEPFDYRIIGLHETLRPVAEKSMGLQAKGETFKSSEFIREASVEVNEGSQLLNEWLSKKCLKLLKKNKIIFLLGGDHSTPFGLHQAYLKLQRKYGILWIDAHSDLRVAFGTFVHSHASIARNIMYAQNVTKMVQVGIRDHCAQEAEEVRKSNGRIVTFLDRSLKKKADDGVSWFKQCREIVKHLPQDVHLSFDIDGLDPSNCRHTGTPVPGGLSYDQLITLIEVLVESGRRIISFDLVEVAPNLKDKTDKSDATTAAQLLYTILALTAKSNKLKTIM